MRAMILAAGLGTRLRPITYGMPKPMVPVLNRPVMEHAARLLARHGFREAIANLHWFPDLIESHFGDGSDVDLGLSYSHEEQLLGTAGGVRNVAEFLGDSFLVVAGDALTDIDFAAMREFHESHDGLVTMATKRVADTDQFGVVIADGDGRIQGFQEKPDPAEALSDLANTCIYMFRKEVFDYFPEAGTSNDAGPGDPPEFADWAKDVFPALLEADVPFYSHEIDAYWNDIGNLDELRQGNLDALHGEVDVEPGAPEVAEGVRAASALDGAAVVAPVLVGSGVEIGTDVRIDGPAIIGDGCRIGDGAHIRDSILLEGAELPAGAILIGGIAARASEN
ncbi:MAG TPA: NDP-sugar synthase [Solirubrobacterales bacterium]|nr:NDP-sugar synthase [Solirubrobacterales bacterium]